MSKKLKPCPFCGSKRIKVEQLEYDEDDAWYGFDVAGYYCMCPCGASGATNKNKLAAIALWNTRVEVQQE